MKLLKTIIPLIFCIIISFSFTNKKTEINKTNLIKINLENNEQGWGSWNTTDCFRGLDFRVKNDGYNKYAKKYRWSIEFRNRYKEKIHFSYKAVAPSEKYEIRKSGRTTDRLHVNGNYGKRGSYYLVKSGSSIYVYVNRVRIGAKDYGYDYSDCDK